MEITWEFTITGMHTFYFHPFRKNVAIQNEYNIVYNFHYLLKQQAPFNNAANAFLCFTGEVDFENDY